MNFTRTDIPDVVLIEPIVRGDSRGYFMETFLLDNFLKEVTNTTFVQENESFSSYGVLRVFIISFRLMHKQNWLE